VSDIPPIFVSVAKAAEMLGLAKLTVYRMCDEQVLVSQYHGKRRLVRLASVHEYADGLPSERALP
jgi:excisionase family DNA binding protein